MLMISKALNFFFFFYFRDTPCPNGQKSKGADPATMIWAKDSILYTRIRFGSPCHAGPNIQEYKLGDIQVGKNTYRCSYIYLHTYTQTDIHTYI